MPQTVKEWLAGQEIDRLDSELILCHVLSRERTWLIAHDEYELTPDELAQSKLLAGRRAQHEPLAYILGHKEFYGREFAVTPDVLIPRPETEQLVYAVLRVIRDHFEKSDGLAMLDVGTGSGAIAVTLALELPDANVIACDISLAALDIARENTKALSAKVDFLQSDLLSNVSGKFDVIVANLPYVAYDWDVSPETKHEPTQALFADEDGESLIKKLVSSAPNHLNPNGILALEMDSRQVKNITDFAVKSEHFTVLKIAPFFAILQIEQLNK